MAGKRPTATVAAFCVALVAVPWAAFQALAASFVASDAVKRLACDIDQGGGYFMYPALASLAAAVLGLLLIWLLPRLAVWLGAGSIAISLIWALRGGWGDFNCAFGV